MSMSRVLIRVELEAKVKIRVGAKTKVGAKLVLKVEIDESLEDQVVLTRLLLWRQSPKVDLEVDLETDFGDQIVFRPLTLNSETWSTTQKTLTGRKNRSARRRNGVKPKPSIDQRPIISEKILGPTSTTLQTKTLKSLDSNRRRLIPQSDLRSDLRIGLRSDLHRSDITTPIDLFLIDQLLDQNHTDDLIVTEQPAQDVRNIVTFELPLRQDTVMTDTITTTPIGTITILMIKILSDITTTLTVDLTTEAIPTLGKILVSKSPLPRSQLTIATKTDTLFAVKLTRRQRNSVRLLKSRGRLN